MNNVAIYAGIEKVNKQTLLCALYAQREDSYLELDHPLCVASLVDRNTPEVHLIKKDNLLSLSEDCQELIDLLCTCDDRTWNMFLNNGRFLKENLNRYLHTEKYWSWKRIYKVMSEIRTFVNEME